MNGRKLALMVSVAASCAGCVTETKSVPMTAEMATNVKGIKEAEFPKREAQPQTWIALGELYESKTNDQKEAPAQLNASVDEARKAYQKAIDIDPKCASAHLHLANLYLRRDDPEKAAAIYQRALQLNPKSAQLWHEYGMACCARKVWNTGLSSLAKAHELEPDNRLFTFKYGLCLARAGRPQEAVTTLSGIMNKADANYNVARMMAHVNQPEQSRQYLHVALAERPSHQGALALLADLDSGGNGQGPAVAGDTGGAGLERASWTGPR